MKQEIQVPEVGESVSSGILASWFKKSGEEIAEGEEIFELETDKATMAVPAPASGVLSIEVEEDTEVEVGQTVAYVDTEAQATGGESASGEPQAAGAGDGGGSAEAQSGDGPSAAGGSRSSAGSGASGASGASDAGDSGGTIGKQDLSPAVRQVVSEYGLDPSKITGTGKDGRITKEDALAAAKEQGAVSGGDGQAGQASGGGQQSSGAAAQAPAGGQESKKAASSAASSSGPTSAPASTEAAGERQTRKKMSTLRKRIAQNLVQSKQNAAHLTTFNEINMQAVMDIRKTYRDAFEEKFGVRLGFMSFFIKAACRALKEFPEVNAYIEGEEIVYNNFYNIGVALSSDRGLIVPVVRDADLKSFAQIESEIIDFMTKAKEKKISPDDLTGGTFTITNGGVFGSLLSTPIPNPPQTGVLGMHSIDKRPVAINDEVVIRPMMYVALTYDHRIIDGREAVRFLVKIKNLIEDPNQLLLDL